MQVGTLRGSARQFGRAPLLVCALLLLTAFVTVEGSRAAVTSTNYGSQVDRYAVSEDGLAIVTTGNSTLSLYVRGSTTARWTDNISAITGALGVSPNGQFVAYVGSDWVKVYETKAPESIFGFNAAEPPKFFSFSRTGDYLAVGTGGSEGLVQFFNTTEPVNTTIKDPMWQFNTSFNGPLHDMQLSHDGRYLICADLASAYLVDASNGTGIFSWGGDDRNKKVAISQDGQKFLVAAYGLDRTKHVVYYSMGAKTYADYDWLYTAANNVIDVIMTPDGSTVLTATTKELVLLNGADGSELANWSITGVSSVDLSDDGKLVAMRAGDKLLKVYHVNHPKPIWEAEASSYAFWVHLDAKGEHMLMREGSELVYYTGFEVPAGEKEDEDDDGFPWLYLLLLLLIIVILLIILLKREKGEEKPTEKPKPKAKPKPAPKPKPEPAPVVDDEPEMDLSEVNLEKCVYCGSTENLHKAHLIAPSKRGLKPVSACQYCNTSKGNKALMEWLRWTKKNRPERWESIAAFNKGKRGEVPKKVQKIRDE